MPETLYLLTRSAALLDLCERTSPGDRRVRVVACLADLGRQVGDARVIVDPRALKSCCIATLRVSRRIGIRSNVRFLNLPMLSGNKHEVQGSVTPCVEFDDQRPTVAGTPRQVSSRAAWARRGRLFAHAPRELRQALFLALARRHRHESYRETDAAADLRVSVRQLTRLAIRWFGLSPRVVIGLFRVESVGQGLLLTVRGLQDLARAHGYCSRQAMNRHFHSFAGVHPAAYRAHQQPREALVVGSEMSEYGPSPGDSDRGIHGAEGTPIGSRPIGVSHDISATVASCPTARLCRSETTLD